MKKMVKNIAKLSVMAVCFASLVGCSNSNISKELKESMKNNGFNGNPHDYVELGAYKGLDVELLSHEVTDEEIEDELAYLAESLATYEEITEGAIVTGDIANIDYEGKLDGEAFSGGTDTGYDLEIGSGTFIDGFEDGLVGVNVGDTVDLELTFPENYNAEHLAGQDVVFTVTVNSISRPSTPEITDELISELSEGEFETVDAYVEALTEQIISEYEQQYELQYYEDIWNEAVDNAEIIKEIPDDLLTEKSSRILLNTQAYADAYQVSFNDFLEQYMGTTAEQYYADSANYATKAAKESLVLWAIADTEGIDVSEEELNEACEEFVRLGSYESVEEMKADPDYKYLYDYVLLSKVQDFLVENAAK